MIFKSKKEPSISTGESLDGTYRIDGFRQPCGRSIYVVVDNENPGTADTGRPGMKKLFSFAIRRKGASHWMRR